MKRTVRLTAVAVALVAMAATGCAGGSRVDRTVSNDGVGPLRIGHSDRAQVIAFAGTPTSESHGPLYMGIGATPVDALSYACRGVGAYKPDRTIGSCQTTFWLNPRTGRLVDFSTRDPRYSTASGVRVGASITAAERATHRTARAGCGGAIIQLGHRIVLSNVAFHFGAYTGAADGHIKTIWLIGDDTGAAISC